jgi:hypothetical protein
VNEQIIAFLKALDELLTPFATEGEYLDMYLLGRSALVLHYGFLYSTNDVDYGGPHCLDQKNAFLSYTLDPSFGLFLRHSVSPR